MFRTPIGGRDDEQLRVPATELREMNGASLASSSNTQGTSTMTVTEAITHLPTVKPHIVAGQVHDAEDDVFEVRLEGSLLTVDHDGTSLGTLDDDYRLGTVFTLEIVAADGRFRVSYNGVVKAHDACTPARASTSRPVRTRSPTRARATMPTPTARSSSRPSM